MTGVPSGLVAGKRRAGNLAVVYGAATGAGTRKVYPQASAGIPGTVGSHDMFGAHLAVGDLDGDGYTDLLVGSDNDQWTQDGIARTATGLCRGAVHAGFGSDTDLVDSNGDGVAEPVASAVADNQWAGAGWMFTARGALAFGAGAFGMTAADSRFGDHFPAVSGGRPLTGGQWATSCCLPSCHAREP